MSIVDHIASISRNRMTNPQHRFSGGASGQFLGALASATEGIEWATPFGVIDVRTYGAVGDGVTDDTAAIQLALDAVPTRGAIVYFPSAEYVVSPVLNTKWLKVKSNTTLAGTGTIRVADDAGDYRTVFGASPTLFSAVENITFRDLTIDQNIPGNITCDVTVATAATTQQAAIAFFAITNGLVERVRFDTCGGINTVVFNGSSTCRDVEVRNCYFNFAQAESSTPGYDNSAIYMNAFGMAVLDNVFETDSISEAARAACEVHTSRAVVANNRTYNYRTIANVVAEGTATEMNAVVSSNVMMNGCNGITLWSITGKTMGNVVVVANSISLANSTWASNSSWGIAFYNDSSGDLDGSYQDINILGNTITAQKENRADYAFASEAGLLLVARGTIRNVTAANNIIKNIPCQGVRLESVSNNAYSCHIRTNQFIDCGNNTSATSGYRTNIVLAGNVKENSTVEDNTIVDTDAVTFRGFGGIILSGGSSQGICRNNIFKITASSGSYVNSYSSLWSVETIGVFTISGDISLRPAMFDRYELRWDALSPAFILTHAQSYVQGQRLLVTFVNNSGGAGPAVTFTGFKMDSWTNPGNGFRKTVMFEFDGTNYKELWRSGSIPN